MAFPSSLTHELQQFVVTLGMFEAEVCSLSGLFCLGKDVSVVEGCCGGGGGGAAAAGNPCGADGAGGDDDGVDCASCAGADVA